MIATQVFERMHPLMGIVGVLFAVVVLGQLAAEPGTPLQNTLVALTWFLWFLCASEYVLRLIIAPSTTRFLRETWWQIVFLVFPVLSIARIFVMLRLARPTRVVLAAFRAARSARAALASRVLWLGLVTTVVVFAGADLVYEFADVTPYGNALHAAAKGALVGEAIPSRAGVAQIVDVVLAVYAVVFFATLAATVGSYFLERRDEDREQHGTSSR